MFIIKKWLLFSFGILVMSIGISMTIMAKDLGVSPWDVFHLGLVFHTPFNYGHIAQSVGFFAIIASILLGIKPRLGTWINMLSVGWIVNIILEINMFPVSKSLLINLIYLVAGIILSGIGTGLYIQADAGSGPRDSLMLGVQKKFGLKVGVSRTIIELTVVVIGYLLSGPIGMGTILYSLSIGFFVEKTIDISNKIKLKFLPQISN